LLAAIELCLILLYTSKQPRKSDNPSKLKNLEGLLQQLKRTLLLPNTPIIKPAVGRAVAIYAQGNGIVQIRWIVGPVEIEG